MAERNGNSGDGRNLQKRRKKKSADKYLYTGIVLILAAIVVAGAIIVLSVGCEPNGVEESSSSHSESTSQFISQSGDESKEESSVPEISKPQSGWAAEDGEKIYIDENGNKVTGLADIDGSIYVFDADGKMEYGGFVSVGNYEYYLEADGKAHIGWLELGGQNYYFSEDGRMAVGEKEIDGKNHFFSKAGVEFIVANPWNEVPDDLPELVTLPSGYGDAVKGKIDKTIKDDLIKMMDDCKAATGHDVYVCSGHRTYSYQQNNYNNQVNVFINRGYSRTEAEKLAAEWVAVPGTSEHHLGTAVDILDTANWSLSEIQETLPGQQWLMENSWKYGFILRYPKDTKDETGINYEPWHYRYLGKELAKEVHDSGMTLEGYIKSITN